MQTLKEIRQILRQAGLSPRKMYGQNFLVDQNLLTKVVELAGLDGTQTVLEVGPGTGTLTEELLPHCHKLIAAEIDRGLADVLRQRLGGNPNFELFQGDVLAGKHQVEPQVLGMLGPTAHLISNLPYNIATPMVAQCLADSWRTLSSGAVVTPSATTPVSNVAAPDAATARPPVTRFDRLTFTVQREVADRFCAGPSTEAYGQVSVLVALLGDVTPGPSVPATSFWPRPTIASRIMRIDFAAARAAELASLDVLTWLLNSSFGQRRKQLGAIFRRNPGPFAADSISQAFEIAGVTEQSRAEQLTAQQFLTVANELAKHLPPAGVSQAHP